MARRPSPPAQPSNPPPPPVASNALPVPPSPLVRRGRVAPYLTRVPGVGWCASAIFDDVIEQSEVAAADLTGLYQKCPDCQCDRICARDGKPIVDLDKLRSPSEVAAPEVDQ